MPNTISTTQPRELAVLTRRTTKSSLTTWSWLGLVFVLTLSACASRKAPGPGKTPAPPYLGGRTVMLLPVQPTRGPVPNGLDEELSYWFDERASTVVWSFPPTLDRALKRSPGLGIRLRSLDVSSFFRAEVKRIGDPLFGDLRRLAALIDARFAIVPVAAAYVEDDDGTGRVEIAAAVIEAVGGRVHWFGVVQGEPGPPGESATTASAAQELARTLFP